MFGVPLAESANRFPIGAEQHSRSSRPAEQGAGSGAPLSPAHGVLVSEQRRQDDEKRLDDPRKGGQDEDPCLSREYLLLFAHASSISLFTRAVCASISLVIFWGLLSR